MKKILLVLLTFTLLVFYSCQEKIDVEKEKTAIIKVLNDEGSRFIAFDMEGVSALHVQSEQDLRLEGIDIYSGWDKIKKLYESYIERNKKDTTYTDSQNIKENIIVRVAGNTAWLVCDNVWKWKVNGQPEENINIQIAFFEKINDEWKFSFNAFMPKDTLR